MERKVYTLVSYAIRFEQILFGITIQGIYYTIKLAHSRSTYITQQITNAACCNI